MTTETQTLQELAEATSAQFETATRDNGETYWLRKRDTEDWIGELCNDAHGDMLPDDWRYSFIVEALDAIAGNGDTDNARDELEPDSYTATLTAWLGSRNDRTAYVDGGIEEWGEAGGMDTVRLLMLGQLAERSEVFDSVRASLEARLVEAEAELAEA